MNHYPARPSERQLRYVAILCRKLRLPDDALDHHCETTWGRPFRQLGRWEVTDLISDMKEWETIPPDLQRYMGQLDLFALGSPQ